MKNSSKRRIFLGVVNYGTQAGYLAAALREKGENAMSYTVYDPFGRPTDHEFRRATGKIGKVWTYLVVNPLIRLSCFFRFNTFHFFFGKTLLPFQLDLPLYRLFGKTVIMEYLGWDAQLANESISKYKWTNARYYKSNGHAERQHEDDRKIRRLRREKKYCDTTLVCAPYISEFVPGAELLPLAVDRQSIGSVRKNFESERPLRILHAPTHAGNKGTQYLETALDALSLESYEFEYSKVEGVSYEELQHAYCHADVFVDQLVSGWYGTASIESMAKGCPTICFLRESYAEHCPYFESIPLLNADPNSIYDVVKNILDGRTDLSDISERSVEFVKQVHESSVVAGKLLRILDEFR